MRTRTRALSLAAGAGAALLTTPLMPLPASAAGPFVVYVAPGATGTKGTAGQPVGSLAAAQAVIKKADPNRDVEVRIKAGTYSVAPKTTWTTYVKGHSISFLPADFTVGQSTAPARPVFVNQAKGRGDAANGSWFVANAAPADGEGRLKFYYLEVRGFQNGITLDGGAAKVNGQYVEGNGLDDNSVLGMVFRQLGDKYTGGTGQGFGALVLTNSSRNQIRGNRFTNVENNGARGTKIHGTYVTHFSNDNVITGNTFAHVSGDPVKFRDRSNRNRVNVNTFTDAGHYSYYREEFCDPACRGKNAGKPLECASGGNRFLDNTTVSGYQGRKIPSFTLAPPGNKVKGPAGCPDLDGGFRLNASGNRKR